MSDLRGNELFKSQNFFCKKLSKSLYTKLKSLQNVIIGQKVSKMIFHSRAYLFKFVKINNEMVLCDMTLATPCKQLAMELQQNNQQIVPYHRSYMPFKQHVKHWLSKLAVLKDLQVEEAIKRGRMTLVDQPYLVLMSIIVKESIQKLNNTLISDKTDTLYLQFYEQNAHSEQITVKDQWNFWIAMIFEEYRKQPKYGRISKQIGSLNCW